MEQLIVRPEIALDQFLPIFVESTLVLVFGVAYAAVITLSKMGYFSKKWMPVGYLSVLGITNLLSLRFRDVDTE